MRKSRDKNTEKKPILKFGWAFLVAFAFVVSVIFLTGCQSRAPKVLNDSVAVEQTDSIVFSYEEEHLVCNIVALMPDAAVRKGVGEWLDTQFGKSYSGDKSDIEAMVEFYGKFYTDSLRSIYAEGVVEDMVLGYNAEMSKLFESDKVVTYGMMISYEIGGPHPLTSFFGATFRKDNGQQLTWDIVKKERMEDFRSVVREKLKGYFEVNTEEDFIDCLQGVEDVNHIPLPVTAPYMIDGGLAFIYQQYEIAAYALGMPNDTISYQQLRPYLTEQALQLIP